MARFFVRFFILFALVSCDTRSDIERANEEKILIYGNGNEPKALDPHLVSGDLESNIIRALFEGLCIDDPCADSKALPGAAAEWESSEDFTAWTFHLQPAAKWSDGTPVTAHDFVFAYRRLLSPAPDWPATYAEMLYFLENAEDYSKGRRGLILFGKDGNFPIDWDTLSQVNFEGKPSSEASSILKSGKSFQELPSAEKAILLNAQGLDAISQIDTEKLDYIRKHPDSFLWPDEINKDLRELILQRLSAFAGNDLWEEARVGAYATDDFTLQIQLRGPVPFLPEITKHPTWYPLPRHIVLKHGEINTAFSSQWTKEGNMVSNGPFQLQTWRTNHQIEVEKNPHYWDAETVSLNGIRFLPISNYYTSTRMFGDEQLHVTYKAPAELIPFLKKEHPTSLRQDPYVAIRYVRTNITRPPFDNPKVRLAFALAIDQQAICEKIQQGGETPASGFVPPFGNYPPLGAIQFDPEKARKLLTESGYKTSSDFPDIELLAVDSETGRREAEALQAMWKEHLGISIRIVQREWTTYLQKQNELDYDIAPSGWIGDYLDPTTFLEMWLKDGGNNNTGWHSEEFERLLVSAENTADINKRLNTLRKAESILMDEVPVLPIYWYTNNYLLRPEVKNWDPLLLDNHPYKFIILEP